jgi:catechol 2,3-dioxygenase-like lactoylglutathione lyase family enzyme
MKLGAFSVSLAVKDLAKSKEFYEQLGFNQFAGELSRNYLILKSGDTIIGLFQGMFDENILTFNPGWDQNAGPLKDFDDVRQIQKHVKNAGINLEVQADESSTGPASFVIKDPDGNTILIDQHV